MIVNYCFFVLFCFVLFCFVLFCFVLFVRLFYLFLHYFLVLTSHVPHSSPVGGGKCT